ncbi:hypothetical protein HK405_011920, partial [Cladochytrium tenue]
TDFGGQVAVSDNLATTCSLAESTSQMLLEALNFSGEDHSALATNEIVQEFHGRCLDLQVQLSRMIERTTDEAHLAQLLQAHTAVDNAVAQYNALVAKPDVPATEAANGNGAVPVGNLIDVGIEEPAGEPEAAATIPAAEESIPAAVAKGKENA